MNSALQRLRVEFKALISDESGSYLALIGFLLTGVLGFAGMGVDLSMWYQEKRTTQNIADAAAVAAVHVSQRGGDLTAMTAAALAEATRNGYVSGPNNQVIVSAAAGGGGGSATPIVDVVVRRAVPLFLMAVFRNEEQVVAAAASGGTLSQGNYCVIGLDYPKPNNTTSRNVEFIGNTTAVIPCGVHSNSLTADSLYIGGNATLEGTPASAAGGIMISGSAEVEVTSQITMQSYYGFVNDPLEPSIASFPDRAFIAGLYCDSGSLVVNSATDIDPYTDGDGDGYYKICGNLTVKPNRTLRLKSGIYYVEDGHILFQGDVEMYDSTDRVTIVLTGTDPSDVGEIDIIHSVIPAGPSPGPMMRGRGDAPQ